MLGLENNLKNTSRDQNHQHKLEIESTKIGPKAKTGLKTFITVFRHV